MRKNLVIVLSLILLSCSPLNKYRELDEVKVWEPDIQKFEQLDKTEKYPDDAILFAGSSSIRLWSTIEKDMAPYHVIQRGYGGAKISDFAVYADRIIRPHPCRAIVLFVANDITGTAQDKKPDEVGRLFYQTLKIIRKSHPKTPVFIVAITPSVSRFKAWPEIQMVNYNVKKLCEDHSNTFFINTELSFLNSQGLPVNEYFQDDKLHLNAKGYEVWSGLIKTALRKVVPHQ
jgi:lysophospholipase L1-like esterase